MTRNGARVRYQRKSNYPNRMEFNSSRSSVGTTPGEQRKKTVKGTAGWGGVKLKWLNRKRKRHPSLWPLTRFSIALVSLFLSRFGGRFHVYFNAPRKSGYFAPLRIEIAPGSPTMFALTLLCMWCNDRAGDYLRADLLRETRFPSDFQDVLLEPIRAKYLWHFVFLVSLSHSLCRIFNKK